VLVFSLVFLYHVKAFTAFCAEVMTYGEKEKGIFNKPVSVQAVVVGCAALGAIIFFGYFNGFRFQLK
jgi:hypothetical protein